MGNHKLTSDLRFFIKRTLYFLFEPEIHVITDSHGVALQYIDFKKKFGLEPVFCIVPGATASGLANPNSKTQAYPIFQKHIKRYVKKNDYLIFQLGEVDCGFTIWYRALKRKEKVEKLLDEALTNYEKFVTKVARKRTTKIILSSAILPTLRDGANLGEIANLRKEVKANQNERTKLTLLFNLKLREISVKYNFHFLDLDSFILNEKTKLIDDLFLNDDETDHHPNPIKMAGIYVKELERLLEL